MLKHSSGPWYKKDAHIKRALLSMIIYQITAQWTIGFSNEEDGFSILSMCSVNDQIKMHECAFLSVTLAVHRGISTQTCLTEKRKTVYLCATAFLGVYSLEDKCGKWMSIYTPASRLYNVYSSDKTWT